jgi:NOL1/NOP2/fmu family ribosome biogenesis protein
VFGYLEDRFGIPRSLFDDYLLFRSGNGWSVLKNSAHLETAKTLKISKAGLKAFRSVSVYVKPTGRAIQIFGHAATRATLEIDPGGLAELLEGKAVPADLGDLERGYVILLLKGGPILGLGFYNRGRVRSQFPRKGVGSLKNGA